MSETVKIVGTPFQEGQTKKAVRKAIRDAYPNFRVASILHDDEGERWLARLVEQTDQVHHKIADEDEGDSGSPFPLKELGPEDDGDSEEEADDSEDEKPKENEDDDELKEDEKPAEDDKEDVKAELGDLLKQFKKLLPALEKVVGPIPGDLEEGAEHLPPGPGGLEDVGPVPGGPPPPGGPPGLPAGPPPAGPPPAGPPRRPGAPGGRRPAGPPRPGVPTFTSASPKRLQRTADITEEEAREELAGSFPDWKISSFENENGFYQVTLEKK